MGQGIEEGTVFVGSVVGVFKLYTSPKIIVERKVARYTGGWYWGFYTLNFTENNWRKKGGKVLRRARYTGAGIGGFKLYTSQEIIGEIKVARY